MAETILYDFAKFVAGKLSSLILEEVILILGVQDELEKIESNLSSIQAVLRDAEKQQATSESVKNWLRNLQDVMYDIDDLLDEIKTEIAIRNKNEGHWRKQVRKFFSRTNFLVLRLMWAHQIKNVCKKLDRVANERHNFVLFTESDHSLESDSRETHSKINKSELILGRDQDKEAVIKSIMNYGDCESLSVLPITGFGGVGKTTLAKLVYNDKKIDESFGKKLWVYVSKKFNIKKILKQILSMLTGEKLVELIMEQLSLEELKNRISECLKDKKYFLILDDVWNEDSNEWRRLKELLDVGAKGSTVVVTTRDFKVASMVKTHDEYTLSELSTETCLQIFKRLAFKDDEEIKPTLLDLSEKIIEKSRGLPLLVTTLGNLLRGITDEMEWHRVMQKLEKGHEDIMNILKLSYEQLPSHLKLCFRICSIFGKGAHLFPLDLVSLWMALGFLKDDQEESLEYIGMGCVNELLSKSLFQTLEDEDDLHIYGLQEFLMHDFVYDLASFVIGDELAVINYATKDVSKNVRYIRIDEDYFSGEHDKRLLNKAKKARLLMLKTSEYPLSKSFLRSIISNLKRLQVLDLEKCQFEVLPRTIGYLKHLRYLSLEGNMKIKLLPDSLCNLLNLQSLLLHGCSNLQNLPTDIGRLENLRCLSITVQHEVLPQSIGLLTAVRILFIKDCPRLAFFPLSATQFQKLESLYIGDCEEFDLAHGSCSLQGLNSLRTILISGLPKFQKLPVGVNRLPFPSLQHLALLDCEGLTDLTDWIDCFTSLRTLMLLDCPNLVGSLHTFSMLKRLEGLKIDECPMLGEKCALEGANSWRLISSSLEYVSVDGERIV